MGQLASERPNRARPAQHAGRHLGGGPPRLWLTWPVAQGPAGWLRSRARAALCRCLLGTRPKLSQPRVKNNTPSKIKYTAKNLLAEKKNKAIPRPAIAGPNIRFTP